MSVVVDPDTLRYERYVEAGSRSWKMDAYYALKPLMPRKLQLALRRAYVPRQARRAFPRWPSRRSSSIVINSCSTRCASPARTDCRW